MASLTAEQGSNGSLPDDPLVGRVINGRFRITALVARGGMGKIYRAEQQPRGRVCALKVLNPSGASGDQDDEFRKRFFLEASTASRLLHPNTVRVFDYGRTDDDIYYMAMEYLDGQTLRRAIKEAGAFSEERAVHVTQQICRALCEAHSLGVIHRDLKPANIFLLEHGDDSDFVKVLDFGLVKDLSGARGEELTRVGVFVGSPKYMSPEQIRGERVDARTDVYALGTILYEMVAGRVPFLRKTIHQTMAAQVNEPPPPLRDANPNVRVSPAFEQTLSRCLAKTPDERFASMDEVLAALKRGAGVALSVAGTEAHALAQQARAENPVAGFVSRAKSKDANEGTGSFPEPAASGSRPTTSPPSFRVGRAKPRSPRRLLVPFLFVAGVAGVGGLLALTAVSPREAGTDAGASASARPVALPPDSPRPSEAASAVSAPEIATVAVRINTDPDGAEVRENAGLICPSTPCEVSYAGPDGAPTKQHKLIVRLAGYRPEVRSVTVGDTPILIHLSKMTEPSHKRP